MKNKDVIAKLQTLNPDADVVIHVAPGTDEGTYEMTIESVANGEAIFIEAEK